jgi:hypothetical protein
MIEVISNSLGSFDFAALKTARILGGLNECGLA